MATAAVRMGDVDRREIGDTVVFVCSRMEAECAVLSPK